MSNYYAVHWKLNKFLINNSTFQHMQSDKVIQMFTWKIKSYEIVRISGGREERGLCYQDIPLNNLTKVYVKYSHYRVLLNRKRQMYQ